MTDSSLSTQNILPLIQTIRGQRVILAADLAMLYGVQTKQLNQQIKRNLERFPSDFVFQLTVDEADAYQVSRSQFVTLKKGHNIKYLPYAFTEHGAIMAANVLNSPQAVAMSVYIVRAFVQQRDVLSANDAILKRLAEIDKTLLLHDKALRDVYPETSSASSAAARSAKTQNWIPGKISPLWFQTHIPSAKKSLICSFR